MTLVRKDRSPSPSPPLKRVKIDHVVPGLVESTSQQAANAIPKSSARPEGTIPLNYRDGVMLAPMVRSGTLPSRLLALKYGADLVWGPEIIDKAIIGAQRVVDAGTGVISYERSSRPIWTTHPIEKPYLIFQVGSSTPSLAVEAALTVAQDVSGVELNCGCPVHFSTHSGMGANLLYTPDLLISILVALREALPPHISLSAKIRVLPDQADTLALVKRIVGTGISALTVHCRTKEMRMRQKSMIERMREIVDTVEEMGLGIPVIYNGDCLGRADAVRVREITGAHSVMVATAAEKNLSCFSGDPLVDAETVLNPAYISLASHLKNAWGNSKHCLSQFSSPQPINKQSGRKDFRQALAKAKDYRDIMDVSPAAGELVMREVEEAIVARRRVAEGFHSGGSEFPVWELSVGMKAEQLHVSATPPPLPLLPMPLLI